MFIAGGFGASPWLFREVGRKIPTKLLRPDINTYVCLLISVWLIYMCTRNKAVAAGAVSYYLDHFVVGRLVRYTYGIPASIPYDPSDPEHRKRAHKKYMGITGVPRLDVFSPTLFKVASFCFQVAHSELNQFSGYAGIGYARVLRQGPYHCHVPSGRWPDVRIPHSPLYGQVEEATVDGRGTK